MGSFVPGQEEVQEVVSESLNWGGGNSQFF